MNEKYKEFLDIVDVPAKSHLLNIGDKKTLERYRVLRTEIEIVLNEGEQQNKILKEEFGIDANIVFQALKNGVYMPTKNFDIVYCKCPKIVHYKNGWRLLVYGANLSLTTYGKTWALTKEELL